MEREQVEKELQTLLDDLAALRTSADSEITEAFVNWHNRLSTLIKARYGEQSSVYEDFAAIDIEAPPELLDRAQQAIGPLVDAVSEKTASEITNDAAQTFRDKRLQDYEEFIRGLLITLR